jgi:tetratricopeptide (TPR) repeat protein
LELDAPQQYCEGSLSLSVATDYFYEISNDLPGREEYNALVALYRKKYWAELDHGIEVFEKTFERSPLREATVFLQAQSLFERAVPGDDAAANKAEKSWRAALLLYPKSTLAPVLAATAGDFLLRTGQFERALSVYRSAEDAFASASLSCVFRMGEAEAGFQLRDWAHTDQILRDLISGCRNFRLHTAALIRQAEGMLRRQDPGVAFAYEKILENDGGYVERFYPTAFFNLGEMKYQEGRYGEAKYYFSQYVKNERKDAPCIPGALKRQADIAAREQAPLETVAGKYLTVHEASPASDWGRFCYAHGLLITLNPVTRPELDRRMRIADDQVDAIKDGDIQTRVQLEKGLASLDWGELGALAYLTKIRESTHIDLQKGGLGRFIRAKIVSVAMEAMAKPEDPDGGDPLIVFEGRYRDWLQGTPDDAWAQAFYAGIIEKRFQAQLTAGNRSAAVDALDHWRASPLWNQASPPAAQSTQIARAILSDLTQTAIAPRPSEAATKQADAVREAAVGYVKRAGSLKPFLGGPRAMALAFASFQAGDTAPLEPYLDKGGDLIAASAKQAGEPLASLTWLAAAQAWRRKGDFVSAEKALASVRADDLKVRRDWEWVGVLRDAGKLERALGVAEKLYGVVSGGDRNAVLAEMSGLVRDGSLWRKAASLLSLAEKAGVTGKAIAPYYYLAGRAAFEQANCRGSEKLYQSALLLDAAAPESPEALYRIGKCLVREKKWQAARDEYDKLIRLNDTFWSALAQNEIKLLSK